MELSEEQKKAIKSLERAFKKCKKARLHFLGMGGEILVSNDVPEDYFHDNSWMQEGTKHVNTHKTYLDSGGF